MQEPLPINEHSGRLREGSPGRARDEQPGTVIVIDKDKRYGIVKTLAGRDIYFAESAVLHEAFDRIEIGTAVRYEDQPGENGSRASTIEILAKKGGRPPGPARGSEAEAVPAEEPKPSPKHMSQKEKEIPLLRTAFEEANHWINQVAEDLGGVPPRCAYHALRGVLFALRDRIPPEEAAHLGDQLPTFVRGLYYESYRHGGKPERIRNLGDFLEKIAHETGQTDPPPDPAAALHTVSAVLASHIDEGQYRHVKHALPLEIQEEMA